MTHVLVSYDVADIGMMICEHVSTASVVNAVTCPMWA